MPISRLRITRGGIATIINRHAMANNPLVQGYDETKPTSYITYLDANNLYGDAMSKSLNYFANSEDTYFTIWLVH